MSPLPQPSKSRGAILVGGLVLLLLALLVLGQEGVRHFRESRQATGPAEWIWAPTENPRHVVPRSFYAVRDFQVEDRFADARLQVLGDEEYRVHLNGRFLGGNVYHHEAQPDVYQVGPWLLKGSNRLVVQGRSVRGGGGLLIHLQGHPEDQPEDQPPITLLASDSTWQVQTKLSLGQLRAWAPLDPQDSTKPVHSWGRPPVGRWGPLGVGAERPLFDPLGTLGADLRPVLRQKDPDHSAVVLLDWGRIVTGYLTLELTPGSGRFARLYLGEDESTLRHGDFSAEDPSHGSPSVPIVGGLQDSRWQDSIPRRFRYARIVGLDGVLGALVTPADETLAQRLTPPPPEGGLLGVRPPSQRSPLDFAIEHTLRGSRE